MFKRESSLVTYDNVIIDFQKGTPVSVKFDFMKLWEFRKLLGESFHSDLLHFYHVHPTGFGTQMSSTDENCLIGLNIALKYSVNFSILIFNSNELFDYRRTTYSWNKETKIFNSCCYGFLGRIVLSLLKNLSEGEN